MNCDWHDVACPCHVQLCAAAAAAAAGFVTVVVVAVTGGSGADVDADAGAVGAAEEHTAPVAVETGIGSTQQDAACGRVGPGHHTQGATALAAPSHLMRQRRRNVTEGATLVTKTHACTYTLRNLFLCTHTHAQHTRIQHYVMHMSHYLPPTHPFENSEIIMDHLKIIVFTSLQKKIFDFTEHLPRQQQSHTLPRSEQKAVF